MTLRKGAKREERGSVNSVPVRFSRVHLGLLKTSSQSVVRLKLLHKQWSNHLQTLLPVKIIFIHKYATNRGRF